VAPGYIFFVVVCLFQVIGCVLCVTLMRTDNCVEVLQKEQ